MPESREFKPLKDIGALAVTDSGEIRFYVDEFKGHKYGSIRTFVKGDTYSGPTKSGVTVNGAILEGLLETLGKLPAEPEALAEKELARWPKKLGVELVLRITIYKDTTGLDLREWVQEETYKGWSKKGVRIPYKELAKTVSYLKEMRQFVVKK
jgi:hypothetical protein